MPPYDECIAALKKTNKKLTDDDIETILSAVDARAKKLGGNDPKLVMKAAKELADEDRLAALIEKRNALINAGKYADLHRFVERAGAAGVTPAQALKAMMGGISKPFAGSRLSVDASGKALDLRWRGSLVLKLQKSGLLSAARSGRHDLDIARELYQLTTPNGKVGVTGNKTATELAGILRSHMKMAVDAQNRAGSAIGSLDGYITRQTHDTSKIRRAGYKPWADKMKQLLDVERTFKGADPDEFLHGTFQALSSGVHLKSEGVGGDKLLAFKGPANLAKKLSAERVLHFKDADAFMAYRKEFGRGGTLLEDVAQTLEHSAKSTALMERFGTNPKAMFDRLRSDLGEKNRDNPKVADKLKHKRLDNLFADISGETRIPGNVTEAQIGSFIRSWNSLTDLGGVLFSSVTDLANRAAESRYQGQGFFSGFIDGAISPLRGRGRGFEREVADLNRAGVEGMLGRFASTISAEDAAPGIMTKLLNTFFRLNGLTWWTDIQKAGAQLMMARHLGKERNKGWDALDEDTARLLSMYDVTKPVWEMIRKEIKPAENGRHYLTVDLAKKIPDEKIDAHIGSKIDNLKEPQLKRLREEFREKLETNLQAYFSDRADYAVPTPGANERAIMQQGTQSGTHIGEGLRMFAQYKAFPITIISKIYGRELYGGQTKGWGEKAWNIGTYTLLATTLGALAITAKDVAKGRTPRDFTKPESWLAAMAQGGGAGIFGDFMFGQANRFGNSPLETMAGPSFGKVASWIQLLQRARDGDAKAGDLFKQAVDSTPFLGLFYVKAAANYLFLYGISENLNPGFLRKMEKRMANDTKQHFIFAPSKYAVRSK